MCEPSRNGPAVLTNVKRAVICAAVLSGIWQAVLFRECRGESFFAASCASKKKFATRRLLVMIRLPFSTEVPLRKSAGIHSREVDFQRSTNEPAKRSVFILSRHAFSQPSSRARPRSKNEIGHGMKR